MTTASALTAREAAALLSFYADAGVDAMLEDEATDLTRLAAEKAEAARAEPEQRAAAAKTKARAPDPPRTAPAVQTTIPDDKAVSDAGFAAESARSLAELAEIVQGFTGCNLKQNARSTILLEEMPESGILMVCGFPTGEDDKAGAALSGPAGGLFERMLAAIGLSRADVGVTTALPWRTPGDRAPTASEAQICQPFLERQIALAEPKLLVTLGNFACRMTIDPNKTVFDLRGSWHKKEIGGQSFETLVTFSPSELLAAPKNKKEAWLDLQALRARLG